MEIESCAMFLVGAILSCCGITVIVATLILLNFLFSKYWQTVTIFRYYSIDGKPPELFDQEMQEKPNSSNTQVTLTENHGKQ